MLKRTALVICLLNSIPALLGRTYNLDELLTLADTTAPAIKIVKEEQAKVEAQIKEAYGSALPRVDFSANYVYAFKQYNPLTGSMDLSMFSGMAGSDTTLSQRLDMIGIPQFGNPAATQQDLSLRTIAAVFDGMTQGLAEMMEGFGSLADMEKDQTITFGIQVQQPIFAQGKVGIGLKVAKIFKESLAYKMMAARTEVAQKVTQAFYMALLAKTNTAIFEEALRLAEESLRMAEVKLQVGKGTELEVLTAKFNAEQARLDVENGASMKRIAYKNLIKTAGVREGDGEFEIEGTFPEPNYTISEKEALARLEQANPHYQQLEKMDEIQTQLVKLAKSDFYPMVYGGGKIGRITQFDSGDEIVWSDDQNVFVGMSVNIFAGGQQVQKVKQAQANKRSFQETKRDVYAMLQVGVKYAYENLETTQKSLASVAAIVDLAEKGYQVAKRSYEVGYSTQLELEKAEFNLKGAKVRENVALYNHAVAALNMKAITNTLLNEE